MNTTIFSSALLFFFSFWVPFILFSSMTYIWDVSSVSGGPWITIHTDNSGGRTTQLVGITAEQSGTKNVRKWFLFSGASQVCQKGICKYTAWWIQALAAHILHVERERRLRGLSISLRSSFINLSFHLSFYYFWCLQIQTFWGLIFLRKQTFCLLQELGEEWLIASPASWAILQKMKYSFYKASI